MLLIAAARAALESCAGALGVLHFTAAVSEGGERSGCGGASSSGRRCRSPSQESAIEPMLELRLEEGPAS